MLPKRLFQNAVIAALVWPFAVCAGEGLADVKVATDTSIDCSSIDGIAKDLFAKCKTDEEKAIAAWYFVRRLHFHWPHIPTWDSIDLINSYGFALCGHQSTMFAQICNAGGVKARTAHPKNHVIAEAWYGDAWHMFDCQVGWFAYRKDKSAVASCEEMKKDPSIISDAIKDDRGSQPFFQCSDNPASGAEFAATARPGGVPEVPKRRLVVNLRRGESIIRKWSNEGKSWAQGNDPKWSQPGHFCTKQVVDANDPVNWPLWKPYAEVKSTEPLRYGIKRTYGNGRLVYEPPLASDAFRDGVAPDGIKGVKAKYEDDKGPNLHPAEAGKPGSVIFAIDLPYIGVDAWLDATALRKTEKDVLSIAVKSAKGPWQEVWRADKTGELKLENISLKTGAYGQHQFLVKFEMQANGDSADVGLHSLCFTTVFMNNIQALPFFVPGKNAVRVTAADGADLARNKLSLEYVWDEQGQEKKLECKIERVPFEVAVDVAGQEMPRMKSIKLSVAP
jgi:hypothetical protein